MKNKKIIPLTITIVAVALVSILGLSKLFENGWQNENTTDNNLTVYEESQQIDTSFDYPYVNLAELDKYIGQSIYEKYKGKFNSYKENIVYRPIPSPSQNHISFQDAANISGEAIKYTFAVTEQSQYPAIITYNLSNGFYHYIYEYHSDNSNADFRIYIDAENGEIFFFNSANSLLIEDDYTSESKYYQNTEVEDEYKNSLEKAVSEYLGALGFNDNANNINYEHYSSDLGKERYGVEFDLSNGRRYIMELHTKDYDLWELRYFFDKGFRG